MPDPQMQQISLPDWEEQVRTQYKIPRHLWRALSADQGERWRVSPETARGYSLDDTDPYQRVVAAAKHLRSQYDSLTGVKDERARWIGAAGRFVDGPDAIDYQGNIRNYSPQFDQVLNKWKGISQAERQSSQQPPLPSFRNAQPRPQVQPRTQSPVRSQAPTREQQMTVLIEAMKRRDFKPEVISEASQRLGKLSDQDFTKEAGRLAKVLGTVSPEEAMRRREMEEKRRQYYAQPIYKQVGQEILSGAAAVGGGIGRAVNRISDPINRALGFGAEVDQERARVAEAERQLAERDDVANSLRSNVTRGLAAGGLQAAIMAPLAAAGGLPAVVLGTAAQQDWERDPAGALASTAGAAVPVYAGRAVSPLAARTATAFKNPVIAKGAQLGVEGLAGAGANVGQYATTQRALGRPIETDEMIGQAVTGGILSTALAPRLPQSRATAPATQPTQATQPTRQTPRDGQGPVIQRYLRTVEEINRTIDDPQEKQIALNAARTNYQQARRDLWAAQPDHAAEPMPQAAMKQDQAAPKLEAEMPKLEAVPLDAIITKAKQTAAAAGRRTDGQEWETHEAAIRDAHNQANAANKRARDMEEWLSQPNLEPEAAQFFQAKLAEARQSGERAQSELNLTLDRLARTGADTPERTPVLETISALRKSGLLTGIKTHIRNLAGTGAFQGAEELARLPAAVVDLAMSAVTKQRTISGPSLPAMARSAHEAATKGVREAVQILKRGAPAEQMEALQLDREINSRSKVLNAYVNGVFRLLGAEDKIFKTYAYRRAIEDRAKVQAWAEFKQGQLKGTTVKARTRELAENPPESMAAEAIADAEVATFNNPNIISDAMTAGRRELAKTSVGKAVNFGLDAVLPFVRTPTNLIARMLEYSPAGFGKNAYQVAKALADRAFTEADQRKFALTFGRASIGSGLIVLGYKLAEAGLATGMSDSDESMRNRDTAAGRSPGAILNPQTNTWHQITGFSPVGSLIAIGASIHREQNRRLKDESSRTGRYAGVGARVIADQPMLAGAREISQALTEPGRAPDKAGRIAGSFVPTIISDVGELTDSTRREGRGFVGQVQKRIPVLRQSLPPATDALGRKLEDRKTAFFDPTLTSSAKDKTRALERELVRLDVGLSGIEPGKNETPAQYQARKRLYGQIFQSMAVELVASPGYRIAPVYIQRAAFGALTRAAKEQAKDGRRDPSKYSPASLLEQVKRSAAKVR